MRLLQVISEYFPPVGDSCGGTQIHLRDLSAALRERGHELEIFASLRGDAFEEYVTHPIEWDGVPVARVTNNFRDVERFEMMYASPKMDSRFRAFLWDREPDLVHFHHLTRLSTTLIEVCAELGLPTVLTLHDYWMVCLRGKRLHPETGEVCEVLDRERCVECLHPLWPTLLPLPDEAHADDPLESRASWYTLQRWERHVKRMLDLVDLVIAPAPFHRDRFVEWGLDSDRCVVVEHGLPTEALRAEPRGKRPVRTIGFIGSVTPAKGVHTLVDAFHELGRKDLRLELHGLVGSPRAEEDYAARLAPRPGFDVELCGPYDPEDLASVLAGIDLLVVPSEWWETFCLTVREGALAGLPVVAARIAGIADAIDAGMAIGFEPGDAADLARVLARVIDDDELRDGLTRKGELVRDMSECAAETERHYEAVLERRKAGPSRAGAARG